MRCKSPTLAGLLFVTALGWSGSSAAQAAPTAVEPAANGPKVTLKSLAAQVAALTQTVQTLTQNVQTLQSQLASANAQNAFALGQFVTVDKKDTINGLKPPHIIFTGGNLHVRSGSGQSIDNTGLGNLVVGYDEDLLCLKDAATIDDVRNGSHNLVVGTCNRFQSSGSFVAGHDNYVVNPFTTVSGGSDNTASENGASVSGGTGNTASAFDSSVSGGADNTVSGMDSSIAGGNSNSVSGKESFIGGGQNQTITGDHLFN